MLFCVKFKPFWLAYLHVPVSSWWKKVFFFNTLWAGHTNADQNNMVLTSDEPWQCRILIIRVDVIHSNYQFSRRWSAFVHICHYSQVFVNIHKIFLIRPLVVLNFLNLCIKICNVSKILLYLQWSRHWPNSDSIRSRRWCDIYHSNRNRNIFGCICHSQSVCSSTNKYNARCYSLYCEVFKKYWIS